MPGFAQLSVDSNWTELFDRRERMGNYHHCTQPRTVVRQMINGQWHTPVFDCPHNQYAPIVAADNCKHFEIIPDIWELWE